MRRSWNIAYLLASACRWGLALVMIVPAGAVLGLCLLAVWLIWLVLSALQGLLARFQNQRRAVSVSSREPTAPSQRRTLNLPSRSVRLVRTAERRSRRHSLEDVQRSISAMARHGWPKSKVIGTLESVGAARVWSQRVVRTDPASPTVPVAGERVHLRYRPGDTVFERYTMPAARIEVLFDQTGRLVSGYAHQDRRM